MPPSGASRRMLNSHGLGRGDRVALVLPNGPEMLSGISGSRLRRRRRAAQSGLHRRRVRLCFARVEDRRGDCAGFDGIAGARGR